MEIKGTVTWVGAMATGMGKNGEWAKQDFVLETLDKYPKKVFMTVWGRENIEKYDLLVGMVVTASIELESREYNGKWYTNVKAWKLQWDSSQKRPAEKPVKEQEWPEPQQEQESGKWPTKARSDVSTDDLPF